MNDIKELILEEIERRRHDYGKRMLQPDARTVSGGRSME